MAGGVGVRRVVVGPLATNSYVIFLRNCCVVVDPGDESSAILRMAEGCRIEYVLATHAHFDHVGAAGSIVEVTGARFLIHREDLGLLRAAEEQAEIFGLSVESTPPDPHGLIEGDEELDICGETLRILHTPGHTRGSISILIRDVLLSGDTLFKGSVGRTDLGGDPRELLRSICVKLYGQLPGETYVLPGHGPPTTIKEELSSNPFANLQTCRRMFGGI